MISRPVALTSVAMKCFERLVMAHINSILPDTLDPLQFAYRPNRSTDDAISITFHTPINIDGAVVEWVESFKFLGVHIPNELS